MRETAYIAINDDGYVTLFWGDGTEEHKTIIARGRRAAAGRALVEAIEELTMWAEDNGYHVVVPAYDLHTANIELDVPEDEIDTIDLDEVDALFEDLDNIGGDGFPSDG